FRRVLFRSNKLSLKSYNNHKDWLKHIKDISFISNDCERVKTFRYQRWKMDNIELVIIVAILALGVFSQWFAWRIQWPSIVIMSIVGLLIGLVIGVINPGEALGDLYNPLISLAVAIILFEGSSSLDLREIKGISKSVFRIITA